MAKRFFDRQGEKCRHPEDYGFQDDEAFQQIISENIASDWRHRQNVEVIILLLLNSPKQKFYSIGFSNG